MTSAGNTREHGRFPLALQVWMSSSFPVGSFAYSHGLEWATGVGFVHDHDSARAWLSDLLSHGAARNDAILLGEAWRAARAGDPAALSSINDLARAMAGSRERELETTAQGNAFLATVAAAWGSEELVRVRDAIRGDVAYPIAVGGAAAAHGLALPDVVAAYLMSTVQNLVSALVRLAVIGQTAGQHVIAALAATIEQLSAEMPSLGLEELGGAAFISDIAAMAHETHGTRLFRT